MLITNVFSLFIAEINFIVSNLVKLFLVENLFSAGTTSTNKFNITNLQHCVYSRLHASILFSLFRLVKSNSLWNLKFNSCETVFPLFFLLLSISIIFIRLNLLSEQRLELKDGVAIINPTKLYFLALNTVGNSKKFSFKPIIAEWTKPLNRDAFENPTESFFLP